VTGTQVEKGEGVEAEIEVEVAADGTMMTMSRPLQVGVGCAG